MIEIFEKLREKLAELTGRPVGDIEILTPLIGDSPGLGFNKDSCDIFLSDEITTLFGVRVYRTKIKPLLVGTLAIAIAEKKDEQN